MLLARLLLLGKNLDKGGFMKKQMLKLWKNPKYREMMSNAHKGMTQRKNPNWKGGKPKCKCGKQLSSYIAKRCPECFHKNRKGFKHTKETKIKMSIAQKGNKSYLWKGGISKIRDKIYHSLEYRTWREKVFKRDNYTCRHCNKKGGYIQPHHIKSFSEYPKLIFVVSNGLTLCLKCHRKTDNFGFRQSNKNKSNNKPVAPV